MRFMALGCVEVQNESQAGGSGSTRPERTSLRSTWTKLAGSPVVRSAIQSASA
jgi:hypothetical protein